LLDRKSQSKVASNWEKECNRQQGFEGIRQAMYKENLKKGIKGIPSFHRHQTLTRTKKKISVPPKIAIPIIITTFAMIACASVFAR